MSYQRLCLFFCGLMLIACCAAAQSTARPGYDINYIGPPMADPVLQHSKETYVLFGCAYCHGLYLVARGEATDLMHSRLVGKDENGNLIGALLRAGIPQTAKLSPMPQFSDLSDQQIADITRWIHFARQQGRFKELTEAKTSVTGRAEMGNAYFEQTCKPCHSVTDLAKVVKTHDPAALRARILRPEFLNRAESWKIEQRDDAKTAVARRRHGALLENFSAEDLSNLMAYMQSLK